jgi:hypothetical protein
VIFLRHYPGQAFKNQAIFAVDRNKPATNAIAAIYLFGQRLFAPQI